jgi:hypothetical protein
VAAASINAPKRIDKRMVIRKWKGASEVAL